MTVNAFLFLLLDEVTKCYNTSTIFRVIYNNNIISFSNGCLIPGRNSNGIVGIFSNTIFMYTSGYFNIVWYIPINLIAPSIGWLSHLLFVNAFYSFDFDDLIYVLCIKWAWVWSDLFSATKSMQNAQVLTKTNGWNKYVCKYIGNIDENNCYIIFLQCSHKWITSNSCSLYT